MSEPVEEQGTSDLVHLVVAGETSAFDVILNRYNRDLVLRAEAYIRRLRMYRPLYEGQEAVDDAIMAMCQRARRGELKSLQDSRGFWQELFVELKRAIRRTRDHFNAQRRSARLSGGMSPRRREPFEDEPDLADGLPIYEVEIQRLLSKAPPPEDLAHVNMEVEALLISLEDPVLQQLLTMRIDEYTVEEIAQKLQVSSRTVNRKLAHLRSEFRSRYLR
jgi:DNA-directed RNA polymerase specialized sigma24 family protein